MHGIPPFRLPPFPFASSTTLDCQELRRKEKEDAKAGRAAGAPPAAAAAAAPAAVRVAGPPHAVPFGAAVAAASTDGVLVDGVAPHVLSMRAAGAPPAHAPVAAPRPTRPPLPPKQPKHKAPELDIDMASFGSAFTTGRPAKKPANRTTMGGGASGAAVTTAPPMPAMGTNGVAPHPELFLDGILSLGAGSEAPQPPAPLPAPSATLEQPVSNHS